MAAVIHAPFHVDLDLDLHLGEHHLAAASEPVPLPWARPDRPPLRLIHGGLSPARPTDPRRHHPSVYRRRRASVALAGLVLVGLAVAAVALLTTTLTDAPPAAPAVAPPIAATGGGDPYVVQPGDTLWSIAERLDLGGDIRATVDRLAEANGGAPLQAGQRLDLTDVRGG